MNDDSFWVCSEGDKFYIVRLNKDDNLEISIDDMVVYDVPFSVSKFIKRIQHKTGKSAEQIYIYLFNPYKHMWDEISDCICDEFIKIVREHVIK